ncbi:hypothetical protein M0811_01921 [Anaeramoeba ignava]|uniref:Uncharacterized protein n=1 Tax=Anaeramoeba ignava TaxID=1746090 RepID=A0A9Q0LGS3_ANAIG|nr:hypothetical protein M0811_01921 [Anaeramoeba ignava]
MLTGSTFSKLGFSWFSNITKIGNETNLFPQTLSTYSPLMFDFKEIKEKVKENLKKKQFIPVTKLISQEHFFSGFLKFCYEVSLYLRYLFIILLINYIVDNKDTIPMKVVIIICLFLFTLIGDLSNEHYIHKTIINGIKLYGTVLVTISEKMFYSKILLEPNFYAVFKQLLLGNYLLSYNYNYNLLWIKPLSAIVALTLIILEIGVFGLVGIGIILIFILLSFLVDTQFYKMNSHSKISHEQMEILKSIISGIREIKINQFENHFIQKIDSLRKEEQKKTKNKLLVGTLSKLISFSSTLIAVAITFILYVKFEDSLTTRKAFGTIILFYLFRQALTKLPEIFIQNRRTSKFLKFLNNFIATPDPILETKKNLTTLSTNLQIFQEDRFNEKEKEKLKDKLQGIEENQNNNNNKDKDKDDSDDDENWIELEDAMDVPFDNDSNIKNEKETKSKEIEKTLFVEESDFDGIYKKLRVQMNNASFKLSKEKEIKNINFQAAETELIGICGSEGSGKKNILLAITGAIHSSVPDTCFINGTSVVISHKPWIRSKTIRENIVISMQNFSENKYQEILSICELNWYLDTLPERDLTFVNQFFKIPQDIKSKIALARALYSGVDIYLFDDYSKMFNYQTRKRIFRNCIQKYLSRKTVIIISNEKKILSKCTRIFMLDQGAIIHEGKFEMMNSSCKEFEKLIQEEENELKKQSHKLVLPYIPDSFEKQKVQEENSQAKTAENDFLDTLANYEPKQVPKLGVYSQYIRYSGGYCNLIFIILLFLISICALYGVYFWIACWITLEFDKSKIFYIGYYILIFGGAILIYFIATLMLTFSSLRASKKIFMRAIKRIVYSPFSFFRSNEIYKITNIFHTNIQSIDNQIIHSIQSFIIAYLQIIALIAAISIVYPWFLIPVFVIALHFFYRRHKNIKTEIQLSNLSLIYQIKTHKSFEEMMKRIYEVRQSHHRDLFVEETLGILEKNLVGLMLKETVKRWNSTRSIISSVIVMLAVPLMILLKANNADPIFAGVAIISSFFISILFQQSFLTHTEINYQISSFSELLEILRLKQEIENSKENINISKEEENQSNNEHFGGNGEIEFNHVDFKLPQRNRNILSDFNFKAKAQDKIAFCGSSLEQSSVFNLIFRLYQIENGKIFIDEKEISSIPLSVLRKNIFYLNSSPTFYIGTLRQNLLSFNDNSRTDEEIWDVLEKLHLKDIVLKFKKKLDQPVNILKTQQIEHQFLFHFARLLLFPKRKIILINEIFDKVIHLENQQLIVDLIQNSLSDSTVLIATNILSVFKQFPEKIVLQAGKSLNYQSIIGKFDHETEISFSLDDDK